MAGAKGKHLSVLIPDGETELAVFVVRCLAQVPGIKLHLLSSERFAPLRFSRHQHKYYYWSGKDKADYLEIIRRIIKQSNIDVLLPVDDPAIKFVSQHRKEIADWVAIVPIPEPDICTVAFDKWLFTNFLQEKRFSVPRTILYTANEDFGQCLDGLQFPVLAKPTQNRGGRGISLFRSSASLRKFLNQQKEPISHQYIVQEFVKGYDIDCSVLSQEGEVLAYTIQKGFLAKATARNFSAPAGIDFINNEQILDISSELISALNWSGVAHIDLRYDYEQKRFKVVELNGRYWGSLMGSLLVGVNFPYLACLAALEIPFNPPPYQLGKYVLPSAALKHWKTYFLQRDPQFKLTDTGLKYLLSDPWTEVFKLSTNFLQMFNKS